LLGYDFDSDYTTLVMGRQVGLCKLLSARDGGMIGVKKTMGRRRAQINADDFFCASPRSLASHFLDDV
jgi:hypothetical protein